MVVDGREIIAQPSGVFLRDIMFSYWYQHRDQFSVYLRLLDIPVPATCGPSLDAPPPSRKGPSFGGAVTRNSPFRLISTAKVR